MSWLRSASWAAFSSSSALERCLLTGLEFLGAGAQLGGQALRALQQLVGTGVGDQGAHADADGLGELVEEVAVDRREGGERGQFDGAQHLVLDHDRQHEEHGRLGGSGAGGDRGVSGRQPVDLQGAPAAGRLADQGLAEAEPAGR